MQWRRRQRLRQLSDDGLLERAYRDTIVPRVMRACAKKRAKSFDQGRFKSDVNRYSTLVLSTPWPVTHGGESSIVILSSARHSHHWSSETFRPSQLHRKLSLTSQSQDGSAWYGTGRCWLEVNRIVLDISKLEDRQAFHSSIYIIRGHATTQEMSLRRPKNRNREFHTSAKAALSTVVSVVLCQKPCMSACGLRPTTL